MCVTGLFVLVDLGRKQLAMHGKLVDSCSQAEGLRRFVSWLENIGKSVVLVAHNCYTFDMRVFVNASCVKRGLVGRNPGVGGWLL